MFIANEWASYEKERKPLRVSLPAGQQRSTYWLNVPFRFAIPKTIMFGLFLWLTSQSLFAVQITTTALSRDPAKNRGISTCGFSPRAIILTTLLGIFLAFIGFVMGSFRFPFGIPMASSCSAAISAGCHPPPDDVDASLRPVQWGAIPRDPLGYAEAQHSVGHCTFTSFPVQSPVPGLLYA